MIRRTIFYLAVFSLMLASCSTFDTKEGKYDTNAIANLDKMSEKIGELNSCSYTLNTKLDKINESNELSHITNKHDVYMRGPDKFYIHTTGTKGRKSFWYNGNRFSYYSFDKNIFDTLSIQGNILDAIDHLHNKFGIDFPAADFFYPTLTDDLMENFDKVMSLENISIDDVEYLLIEASSSDKVIEIWIEKNTYLPYKLSMFSLDNSGTNYEAVFSNWKVDPNLPDMLFEFKPSENSSREQLKSNN